MPFSQALYYPYIDITDESWLKTALLYWDSVRTIVPASIDEPYHTETGRILQDANFLVPLKVHSQMQPIEELCEDMVSYLGTAEGVDLFSTISGSKEYIHNDKLVFVKLEELASMHPEKFDYRIQEVLTQQGKRARKSVWIEVDRGFAVLYMTLLASRLANQIGAGLLTPILTAESLSVAARLDTHIHSANPRSCRYLGWYQGREYSRENLSNRTLIQGMLANLAIEKISIDEETPVESLLEFKEAHKDELLSFRNALDRLTSSVNEDIPLDAMRQKITDIYDHEVGLALRNLKSSLEGRRIRWLNDGLLKISFISVGASSILVASGLPIPTALLAGAGVSLVALGIEYNIEKKDELTKNPYSYLLSIEKELPRKVKRNK